MHERYQKGDILVLFPEGTSSDGKQILPFKSALFPEPDEEQTIVQPLTIHYLRNERHPPEFYGWYGDLTLLPHLWKIFGSGSFRVDLEFHDPIAPPETESRKALAATCEAQIRETLAMALKETKETSQSETAQRRS